MSIPSLRLLLMILAMVVVSLSLVACEAKITQENYDKISTGMSKGEVERLLGSTGEDETGSGTSITGAGIGDSRAAKMQVFRWKDGTKHIIVTFKDGKVFEKTQQGLQ